MDSILSVRQCTCTFYPMDRPDMLAKIVQKFQPSRSFMTILLLIHTANSRSSTCKSNDHEKYKVKFSL